MSVYAAAPSEEESESYYDGLPSRPRLIARSSQRVWTPQRGPLWEAAKKELRPIDDHDIVPLWNMDGQNCLRSSVVEILDLWAIDWTSLDVLRIGLEESGFFPAVIAVGVSDAVKFPESSDAIRSIMILLSSLNLSDVEVEFRRSYVNRLVIADSTHNTVHPAYQATAHKLSDVVGNSIASGHSPGVEGTRGVFLRTVDPHVPTETFALTCRHVFYASSEGGDLRPSSQSLPIRTALQPGDLTLQRLEGDMANSRSVWESQLKPMIERQDWNPVHAKMKEPTRKLEAVGKLETKLKQIATTVSRVFGSTAFSRHPAVKFHEHLSDWLLVKLDQQAFENNINQLTNVVYLPNINLDSAFGEKESTGSIPATGLFRLNGHVPSTELWPIAKPILKGKIVGKCGRTTGHTWGTINQIQSVIRTPSASDGMVKSAEICVIHYPKSKDKVFSGKGDSGSTVFDLLGRVVGTLSAGATAQEVGEDLDLWNVDCACDISYVSPIAWQLEDMEDFGIKLEVA
ncbi:hypothetical protein CKAH01_16126 [Colletotrichum kahawae]|uniref:Uncharacterized protein n=1 Tax=Colletotrichum kahawae TaxID=34407 RepID=A0AAD9YIF7_COLKA|nr:hypothetical protein CKAH01_16126 [Colletotrichum kahawae]